ncbi:hypothetical protein Q4Q54_00035 [Shewanella sp. SP2S2-4]|uniref:hypothetical protein n=1 Tax=Shewanella sp. SP2S2-4 TaxID=3063539 RepID=UPI00289009AA|nr:hypothetical protein [Shewanella sp. SP2S2-4]MDT3271874.1 hypothetical protein [Shewanella sp. SP2S2-4]
MLKVSVYGLVALLIIGVLGLYYFNFNVLEISSFSEDQSDWGNFGSYFGGVVGPVLAFLAYLGVKEQIKVQQQVIDQQSSDKALEDHLLRIKESFERLVRLTDEAIHPLEKQCGILLRETLSGNIEDSVSKVDTLSVINDLIHAGRLIQGAQFVFTSYLALIDESSKHLKVETPLNEHKWVAIVTWREFEKKALFLFKMMKKAQHFTKANPSLYSEENVEVVAYIAAFESWQIEWKRMGLGF